MRFYSSTNLLAGVRLDTGGSSWNTVSDSTMKRNIRAVDTRDILDRVTRMPMNRWSYKTQDDKIEHIGPMAQDFYALFSLGEDDKTISTIDPSGVALAAIQELAKENVKLETRILKQDEEIAELRAMVQSMAAERKLSQK